MYVCNNCGSKNIAIKAWIDPNTDEIISDIEEDVAWCNDCEDEVRMIFKPE